MTPNLQATWYPLTNSQRMRRAYEIGVDESNRPQIDELERGDSFARRLAMQTIYGSRDADRAARLVNDPSRLVRHGALKLLAMFGSPRQLEPVFLSANPKTRGSMMKVLSRYRRLDVIDSLCLALRESGGDWQFLAPYASHTFLQTHFDEAFVRAGYLEWSRLTRHHPRFALEKLLERVQNAAERDATLLYHANVVLGVLGSREADPALTLIREMTRHFALGEIGTRHLLPLRPEELAHLALSGDHKISLDFSPFVSRLQPETVRQLLLRRPDTLRNADRWMRRIPLGERESLWNEFGRGWRSPQGTLSLALLPHLPRAIRESEARRHLALPKLALPEQWTPYAAFLDHEEMLQRITPLLGDPDPDLRVVAWNALTRNVRFARDRLGELLERIQKRGNEQDPVRQSMLAGLAALPPSIWRQEHLATLETIQRQALDARDLSPSTASQLERLIIGLLPHFASWSATQLAILVKERGTVAFWNLESRLNNAQMHVVGPQILPVFQTWTQRDHTPFLGAMRSLGLRLKVWDEGAVLLADFTKSSPTAMATTAASILAKYRPDVFALLVPQLLQIDPSWGVQEIVYNHIHRKRQDLWTPTLLGREKPKGRFWTGKTRFVLPLRAGFARWNPDQQTLYAQTLTEVIDDTRRDTPGAIFAIDRLAELPDIEPTTVLSLSRLDNPKPVTREAALRVLSRLDSAQGVPLLIEALDDARARIAIYSLRRALMEMPEPQALEILRATPLVKVTVAKEVVRLLGDLKSPTSFALILEFASQKLHRDVQIALLRGLWEYLEDDRVWPILETAATSPDPAIARMAARTTAPRLSKESRHRLNALRATLLSHPETRVRLEVLNSLALGATDPEKLLRDPLFKSLQSEVPIEYSAAARAIFITYSAAESEIVTAAIANVIPHRRALKTILEDFASRAQFSRSQSEPLARAILRALETDPLLLASHFKLAFTVFPAPEFANEVETALNNGSLHAGVLFDLIIHLQQTYFWGDSAISLPLLQERWANSSRPELRRLALAALINSARDAQGWTQERLQSLEGFRHDPSPLVASTAQWIFPTDQDEEEFTDEEIEGWDDDL